MTDLAKKLEALMAIELAKWQLAQLKPLVEALSECAEATQDHMKSAQVTETQINFELSTFGVACAAIAKLEAVLAQFEGEK